MTHPSSGGRTTSARRSSPAAFAGTRAGDGRTAGRRVGVPAVPGFPAGLGCDAVETSAAHGRRILDRLPRSGCILADGGRWLWIVPPGSDIGVTWPPIARYLVDAAVLVPLPGPHAEAAGGRRVVHWADRGAPYTHPILLHLAACGIAGTRPAMAVRHSR